MLLNKTSKSARTPWPHLVVFACKRLIQVSVQGDHKATLLAWPGPTLDELQKHGQQFGISFEGKPTWNSPKKDTLSVAEESILPDLFFKRANLVWWVKAAR